MQNDEEAGKGEGRPGRKDGSGLMAMGEASPNEEEQKDTSLDDRASSSSTSSSEAITIIVSKPAEVTSQINKSCTGHGKVVAAAEPLPSSPKKEFLQRNESYHEVCRVCHQQTEEPLLDLGCGCRGELAKSHRSCIEIWFRTRGSNKCEICQHVAANIPSPDSLQSSSYWIWRSNSASGTSLIGRGQQGCCSPIWLAFSILVGGLFLDVLLSVSLGVSAMPVNIIVGVLILLGLGTAFRLALECCHEWSSRRNLHVTDTTLNPGYPPTV